MTTEQLLRSAVSKLGPIAAANALTAFETGERKSWSSCVLARAYGADGELQAAAKRDPCGPNSLFAAQVLGLTQEEAVAVMGAFDGMDYFAPSNVVPPDTTRALLRSLLEEEASKLTTVPSPARGSAEQSEAAPDSLALVSR